MKSDQAIIVHPVRRSFKCLRRSLDLELVLIKVSCAVNASLVCEMNWRNHVKWRIIFNLKEKWRVHRNVMVGRVYIGETLKLLVSIKKHTRGFKSKQTSINYIENKTSEPRIKVLTQTVDCRESLALRRSSSLPLR